MSRWAEPTWDREQYVLFSPTLDAWIAEDHPVRVYEELAGALDWSEFEARYDLVEGRRAIHPRVLGTALIYALRLGIRSSRKLEDACRHRLDLMWLMEGREVDHATWAGFRKRFRGELKRLGRQFVRLAVALELVSAGEVAADGTRVEADSSRRTTATAASLERRVVALSAELEAALEAMEEEDQEGEEGPGGELPPGLRRKEARLARLKQAAAVAREADAAAGQTRSVPVADPEARVLPNKGGGYAPNYTPVVVTESGLGLVVASEVAGDGDEVGLMLGLVAEAEATTGQSVERVLADAAFGTGQHLAACEARGIELLAPLAGSAEVLAEAPQAERGQPLAEEGLGGLPQSKQTRRWHRSCFAYEAEADVYVCPLGEALRPWRRKWVAREAGRVRVQVYRCESCGGCAWREACLSAGAQGRTIERDEHTERREAQAKKLRQPEVQAAYRRRAAMVETVFGVVKGAMGLRRFLLRGLEKVRIEWEWACLAYNFGRVVAALRQAGAGRVRAGVAAG